MEKNINKVRSKVIARYYKIKNFIIKLQICRARQYKYIFKKRGKHLCNVCTKSFLKMQYINEDWNGALTLAAVEAKMEGIP